MPRFAANLGFSPLQPMKPVTNAPGGVLKPIVGGGGGAAAVMMSSATGIADVPAAQFDWDSSGLVNPLHGESEGGDCRQFLTYRMEWNISGCGHETDRGSGMRRRRKRNE